MLKRRGQPELEAFWCRAFFLRPMFAKLGPPNDESLVVMSQMLDVGELEWEIQVNIYMYMVSELLPTYILAPLNLRWVGAREK